MPPNSYSYNDIYGFKVGFRKSLSQPDYVVAFCNDENCSYVIEGLNGFTEYTVTVHAFNSKGSGPKSDGVTQYTADDKPDMAPTGVKCETLSSDEIRVSWENLPLESLHGTFKRYNVIYAHALDKDNIIEYITTANETILNGLKPNSVYLIKVSATSSGGVGPQSFRISCETDEDGIFTYGLKY